ncbi:MAG: response regulator [Actinomycetota bacterium]|nr:response regulator [Actinomycetota bacterium]
MARIIAIEDSPALQRFFEITMRGTGIDVEPHLCGFSGLEAVLAAPPDLVILDLGLPDVSGWQILDRLRGAPATVDTPVLITTGESRSSVIGRATTHGAATIQKPYTGAALRAMILGLIDTRSVAESPT